MNNDYLEKIYTELKQIRELLQDIKKEATVKITSINKAKLPTKTQVEEYLRGKHL